MTVTDSLLRWVRFAMELLPVVLQVVTAIEDAVHTPGSGAVKRQMAIDTVHAAVAAKQDVYGHLATDHVDTLVGNLVDASVSGLNRAGVFQHSPPPAPSEPQAPQG